MTTGTIYVATCGQYYIDEACRSAASCKDVMPNIHITLFSDKKVNNKCFDSCIIIQSTQNGYLDKIVAMSQSPYKRTLFLDTDTYICADFSELFTLLDKYDIGILLGEHRTGEHDGQSWDYQALIDGGKWLYPLVNSGVILYRKSPKITKFLFDWFALAEKQMNARGIAYGDQPAFTPALFKSKLRDVILPPEYNCRFTYPLGICGRVKILHGRHRNLQRIATEINNDTGPRIWHPNLGLIPNSKSKIIKRAGIKIFHEKIRGALSTIRRLWRGRR